MVATEEAAAFVDFFARGWSLPKPQAFIDHFWPRVHPEIHATQPMFPAVQGKAAFEQFFRRSFAILPDLTATVLRWGDHEQGVYIESNCSTTIGRRILRFRVCDVFVLRDGMIVERHSYFDPSPLFRAFIIRPWLWPRLLRGLPSSGRS